jgi:hypothetical protein
MDTASSEQSFLFEEWAEKAELTRKTVKYLRSEELMTIRTLSLITEKDIVMMPLPMGQRKLLMVASQELCAPPRVVPHVTPPEIVQMEDTTAPEIVNGGSPPGAGLDQHLAQLFEQIGSSKPSAAYNTGEHHFNIGTVSDRVDLNPLSYLLPRQRPKYLDITDFVQTMGKEVTQEEILGESQGGKIVYKSGARNIKLDQVSPMQWSAVNMRIAVELIRTEALKQSALFDYMAYTVKVSELADTYMWVSILQYDRAYRQLQAQHGFRWGSDSPHLDTLHLRARQYHQFPAKNRQSQSFPRATPANATDYSCQGSRPSSGSINNCRLYQRNACPWGENCRYSHVCSAPGCGQQHPLAMHGRSQPKN